MRAYLFSVLMLLSVTSYAVQGEEESFEGEWCDVKPMQIQERCDIGDIIQVAESGIAMYCDFTRAIVRAANGEYVCAYNGRPRERRSKAKEPQ